MGEVWLAEDPLLRRQVAIKRLLLHHMQDDEYLQRFEREARAAAALHHPNILPLHDYGQQRLPDGRVIVYIVMSYVSGGSVEDRLDRLEGQGLSPSPQEAFGYLSQAAHAIDFAHERGVLHRDIKPANMLLRDDNTLLLADFGLARLTTEADTDNLTRKSMLIGTPKYMAPEQAQGNAVAASDIYSLAVLAYRCFTGRYPFNADTVYAMIVQHAIGTPTAPRLFNPELTVAFEAALLRGLAKDPAQRPSTATRFVEHLQRAMHGASLTPQKQQSPSMVAPSAVDGEPTYLLPAEQVTTRQRTISRRALLAGSGVLVAGSGLAAFALSPLGHALFAPTQANIAGQHQASPVAKSAGGDAPVMQIQTVFSQPVVQLAWSPTGTMLAASGQSGQMVLWNIGTNQSTAPQPAGQHLFSYESSNSNPVRFAWSPRGDMLAISKAEGLGIPSNALLVYKSNLSGLATGFSANTLSLPQPIAGVCWAPGRYLLVLDSVAVFGKQSALHLYDPKQPHQVFQSPAIALTAGNGSTGVMPLALAPDGVSLAIAGRTSDVRDGVLVGKVVINGTRVDWQPQPLLQTLPLDTVAWSPDSRYLAASSSDIRQTRVLYVWDATRKYQALTPALDLDSITGQLTCVAWSPNRTHYQIASGSTTGKVYIWDIKAGPEPVRTLPGIAGNVTALAWSNDGQWLAASYDDVAESILIWKVGNTHG